MPGFSSRVKWNPFASMAAQFTNHITTMKPTVPKTLIGGKSLTVSRPCDFSMLKAVVFDNAKVGI